MNLLLKEIRHSPLLWLLVLVPIVIVHAGRLVAPWRATQIALTLRLIIFCRWVVRS